MGCAKAHAHTNEPTSGGVLAKGYDVGHRENIKLAMRLNRGKMHIEANRRIGDYCLIANRVAIVGRHDHDYPVVGYPTRYEPWIGSKITPRRAAENCATIEQDLRIGCKSIVSAGVTLGGRCHCSRQVYWNRKRALSTLHFSGGWVQLCLWQASYDSTLCTLEELHLQA